MGTCVWEAFSDSKRNDDNTIDAIRMCYMAYSACVCVCFRGHWYVRVWPHLFRKCDKNCVHIQIGCFMHMIEAIVSSSRGREEKYRRVPLYFDDLVMITCAAVQPRVNLVQGRIRFLCIAFINRNNINSFSTRNKGHKRGSIFKKRNSDDPCKVG